MPFITVSLLVFPSVLIDFNYSEDCTVPHQGTGVLFHHSSVTLQPIKKLSHYIT